MPLYEKPRLEIAFFIGALLAVTVMLGTGAVSEKAENLDAEQQWLIAEVPISEAKPTKKGWEPISSAGDGLLIVLRRPYETSGSVVNYEDQRD